MAEHSVLIVGCGSIGERHLRCFRRTGRARVSASEADPGRRRQVAEQYGVPVAPWPEALEAGVDAVVIATPAPLHVPMAAQALAAGRHVLVEKPLACAWDGVDELLALAARPGRQSAAGYVHHTHPFLVAARDFLRAGGLGQVRQASVVTGEAFHRLRAGYAGTYYREHRTGGGAIQDALTHFVNWMESVLGPVDRVLADRARQMVVGVEVEDTVHALCRHGAVPVSYALNQYQAPGEATLQFQGTLGSLKVEFHRHRWGTFLYEAEGWDWRETPPRDADGPYLAQAEAFLDQLEGRPARLCSLRAAAQTLRFNLAALAAAERGSWVECGRVGDHPGPA